MELIVGFNLSSYSHCTSYTRLTTDTGSCCRACGWPFIKSTCNSCNMGTSDMRVPMLQLICNTSSAAVLKLRL